MFRTLPPKPPGWAFTRGKAPGAGKDKEQQSTDGRRQFAFTHGTSSPLSHLTIRKASLSDKFSIKPKSDCYVKGG